MSDNTNTTNGSGVGLDVIHPAHYHLSSGREVVDVIREMLTEDEFRGYCKGSAIERIARERRKGGDDDLRKAGVNLTWAVESGEGKP